MVPVRQKVVAEVLLSTPHIVFTDSSDPAVHLLCAHLYRSLVQQEVHVLSLLKGIHKRRSVQPV